MLFPFLFALACPLGCDAHSLHTNPSFLPVVLGKSQPIYCALTASMLPYEDVCPCSPRAVVWLSSLLNDFF